MALIQEWLTIGIRHQYLNVSVSHAGFEYVQLTVAGVDTFPGHRIELPQVCRARQRAAVDIALTESGAEVGTAVLESAYLAVNIK
jgi:hypothetical protein